MSNTCVVYIENDGTIPEVAGFNYIGEKLTSDNMWTDIILLTDSDSHSTDSKNIVTVLNTKIVSDRPFHDIEPKKIYYFVPTYLPTNDMIATGFVIKSDIDNPLGSTTKNGLG